MSRATAHGMPQARRRRRARTGAAIGLCWALASGGAVAQSVPAPLADQGGDAVTLAEQACQQQSGAEPPGTDLAVQTARLRSLHSQSRPSADDLPKALALSCGTWRLVQTDAAASDTTRLEWLANVGGSLLYLGRRVQGESLLRHAYQGFAAAGAAVSGKAAHLAGTLAFLARQRDDSTAALEWSQRSMQTLDAGGAGVEPADRLALRINHASHLMNARRFDEADAWARGLWLELEPQLDTQATTAATVLNLLSVNAQRQMKLDHALAHAQHELALRQARLADDPVRLGNAWHSVGLLMQRMARFDEAASAMEAAVRIGDRAEAEGRAVDLSGMRVIWLNNLSALQLARGQPGPALATAQRAAEQTARGAGAGSAFATRAWRQLAEAQLANGQLAAGLDSYRAAEALLQRAGTGTDAGTLQGVRHGLARTLLELGDNAAAQALLRPDGPLPRPTVTLPDEQVDEHLLQAALARARGDTPAALAALRAADAAMPAAWPAGHPRRRMLAAQRCELDSAACDALAAEPAAQAGAQSTPEADALVQLALAQAALAQGRTRQADAAAARALAAALASGQPRLLWRAYQRQAHVAALDHRLADAVLLGKLAITTLQQQRASLWPLGSASDGLYMADKADPFRQVAHWLLQLGRVPEALEVMRLLKQHEQDDFLARGAAEAGAAVPTLTAAEQQALQRFQAQALPDAAPAQELQRLGRLAAAGRITPDERAQLERLQQQAAAQQRDVETRLRDALVQLRLPRPAPGSTAAARTPPAGTTPLRPAAGTLRVWLLAGQDTLDLLLVGPRGVQQASVALPSSSLARQIAELHDTLQQPGGNTSAQGRQLYQAFGRLLDAAAREQGARRINLWLDGPLRYLPPGLMHDGQQFLAERYAFSVQAPTAPGAPATATQRGAAPAATAPRPSVVAFGVTHAWQGLPALPAVADEVCGIVAGPVLGLSPALAACGGGAIGGGPLRGEGRLDAHFTEAALTRSAAADSAGVLHIGTHFVLRPGNVANSWLLLGDGQRLALRRLRTLPLGARRLVTLSACETAVTDSGAGGREVDGLATTLLDNGAQQVLASLWRVDDRATARFMQHFYRAYVLHRGDAASALQVAQRASVAAGEPARHWAAFVLLAHAPG